MAEQDHPDTLVTWAVRGISARNRDRVLAAARQQNVTAGAMSDRAFDHYFADGAPMPVAAPASAPNNAEIAALAQAALALATAAGVPIPRSLATAALSAARRGLRESYPAPKPRQPPRIGHDKPG